MASTYYSILSAAFDAVSALTAFQSPASSRTWKFSLRDAPRWEGLLDSAYGVVVAPKEGLAEIEKVATFSNVIVFGYEVYIGVAVPLDKRDDTIAERMLIRESVRLAMYTPTLFQNAIEGQFNVEYDPAPSAPPGPPQLRCVWQRFIFWCTGPRSA